MATLVGCQGATSGRRLDNDPYFGGSGERPPPGALTSNPKSGEVPPVPPAQSSTSPAALTQGSIDQGDRRTQADGVVLRGPRGKDGNDARPPAPPPDPNTGTTTPLSGTANASPAGAGPESYEALQKRLQARGVVWQQLKMVDRDEWQFNCAIPNPNQPNVRRNYEVRAAGPNGLAAIRMALEKIDQETN
ncbi:MAG: hypothetical protein U0840_16665 [Gemmataceae bacterium]